MRVLLLYFLLEIIGAAVWREFYDYQLNIIELYDCYIS